MGTRCLQKTGGSSYTITLPKSWVSRHQLGTKGIVELHEHSPGQLILRPHHPEREIVTTLEVDYLSDERIIRELIGIYISGAESIQVTARAITYEQRALIRSTSYKLIGFELFDQTSSRMLLKNVANSKIAPSEYVHKIIGIISGMYEDVLSVIATGNKKLARDIIERDVEIDRIHLVILRQFNQSLRKLIDSETRNMSLFDIHYYEIVSLRLERIADHMVRIAQTISLLPDKEKILLNKFETANTHKVSDYLNFLASVIQTLDTRQAHHILDLFAQQKKNEYLSSRIIKKSSLNILIEDSLERIRGYIANIAEETVNYSQIRQTIEKSIFEAPQAE